MIDPRRWILVETWLSLGLRVEWMPRYESDCIPMTEWMTDDEDARRFVYAGNRVWQVMRPITCTVRTYERVIIEYGEDFIGPIEPEAFEFEYQKWITVGPDDDLWLDEIYDKRFDANGYPHYYTQKRRVSIGQSWPVKATAHRVYRYYESGSVPRWP